MHRTPHVHDKFDLLFFGQSDNFHFSKVAHCFSFCEARSKMASKKRRATKLAFFERCVFTMVFKCFVGACLKWFFNIFCKTKGSSNPKGEIGPAQLAGVGAGPMMGPRAMGPHGLRGPMDP